jgi:hypothetical protein
VALNIKQLRNPFSYAPWNIIINSTWTQLRLEQKLVSIFVGIQTEIMDDLKSVAEWNHQLVKKLITILLIW